MTDYTPKDKFEFDASDFDPGFTLDTDTITTTTSTSKPSDILTFITEQEIMAQEPPEYIVDGWLPEKSLALMWGKSSACKSFGALHMAMCVSHGMEWYGQEVRQGAVCYIAAEGAGGFGSRVKAWKQHHNTTSTPSPFFTIGHPINLTKAEEVDRLIHSLQHMEKEYAFKFELVIFDTLARCMRGGEENSNTVMGEAVDSADKVKKALQCTALIVHHAGKNQDNGARGASALTAAADTVVMCEKDEQNGIITFELTKQKDDRDGLFRHFEKLSVVLPPTLKGKPRDSLVLIERGTATDYPFIEPNNDGDITYHDLLAITSRLTPDYNYTVTQVSELVFNNKRSNERVSSAVPETWRRVKLSNGEIRSIRRFPKEKGNGVYVLCRVVEPLHPPHTTTI